MSQALRAGLVGLVLLLAQHAAAEPQPETRVFEIIHREVDEAYLAIVELLGPAGEVSLSKARAEIRVVDEPARLAEIGAALARFDVPAVSVRLDLRLVRAEQLPQPAERLPEGVPPDLGKVVKFNSFEQLGVAELVASEEQQAEVDLGPGFRVRVELGRYDRLNGVIEIQELSLLRVERDPSGEERFRRVAQYRERLRPNRRHIIGASTPEQAERRMLFLLIQGSVGGV